MTVRRSDERRLRRTIVALAPAAVLAALVVGAGTPSAGQTADDETLARGRDLYEVRCSSCHGADAGGGSDGPSLLDVGPASLDFQMSSGRMPLADVSIQPQRAEPTLSPDAIRAIIAYVESLAPGGVPIPDVDARAGSLPVGQQVYAENCAACHGAGAGGDSIGGHQIAPGLYESPPLQIAEAIRVGPGAMPAFGDALIDQHELDSVTAYLTYLDESGDRGGLGLGRVGPVTEGFVAALIGLGVLIVVIRLTGSRE